MKRVGLCGGTYDPVHNGHVSMIRAARESGYLDSCIVMPAGLPPHKLKGHFSPAAYRVEMAAAAFRDLDDVTVSDLEIRSHAPSYTLRTIEKLSAELAPGTELVLVYGSDILLDIDKWYEPEKIFARCPFYLANRGGYNEHKIEQTAADLRRRCNARISFFSCPRIELSSTGVRQAVSAGADWSKMVPPAVAAIIKRNGLYQNYDGVMALDDPKWLELMRLEQDLWTIMPRSRLIHSLNTMVFALHLALRHGVDLMQAGLAALLHDCAKDLTWKQQKKLALQSDEPDLIRPVLVHGPASAIRARDEFGVNDPMVLQAITCHTTGRPGMSDLDKIIFLADKIEPARTYSRLDDIRELALKDLNRALLVCLDEIDLFLERDKIPKHHYSALLRQELKSILTDVD